MPDSFFCKKKESAVQKVNCIPSSSYLEITGIILVINLSELVLYIQYNQVYVEALYVLKIRNIIFRSFKHVLRLRNS